MARCDSYFQHGLEYRCYSTEHPTVCTCGGDQSKCDFFPEKRNPKPMAKCGDCLHFGFCKKYVDPEETFPEVGGCPTFENKDNYVEVVRCKYCTHWKKCESSLIGEVMCCTGQGSMYIQKGADDFCSSGERKNYG